ncbi:sulfate adenylyltransferase subunit 1 [Kerstersia gyiorum]|jgi:sulfate adenylyltransferase subunit 1|uniref:sulfate adenylyltransferase subunit 1 n=1 Tax=Kerstersia gyiorum TaxID=206506 RepID=UPI0010711164|nr:GTP-binding protein [Kerstersia gyiorum]MCO7641259.1 GTP-binding protein [Pseudomonas sp. S 311-6]MCH4270864.1 GTP-binding protein [Kerstersia gyiorum]MCI1229938.1 GTP-binding protein [Kerstersia gyiorum]MCP1634788.1 sulfate adenylyltransferase subunit 1 [Kerstersia gyiorum]MCP1638113.1 sulfate adenylyltransferase subunit 1 [Kerstersia gyiorum]
MSDSSSVILDRAADTVALPVIQAGDSSPADGGVLRFVTAGSVDDGKSTLIGRLLFDSKGVFADQLDAIARAKYKRTEGDAPDLALLTDGLEAEREQGITIDVAYRYFATPRRKFIVADAPGHEQYTRNMVTAASTADAAIILIDATRAADGKLLTQTKRHSAIARLLGIRHIIVAVNKMDLLDWDRDTFERIRDAYAELARRLDIPSFHALPLSALKGDNVVTASARTPWYDGPTLLNLLESLPVDAPARQRPLRLPVQWVIRHGGSSVEDFRGYAGLVSSGELRVGDAVQVQPSGVTASVQAIYLGSEPRQEALAGDAVTVVLDRDVDVSRGDLLVHAHAPARVERAFEADICWLDTQALNPARRYLLKHGSRLTSVKVKEILSRRDIHELAEVTGGEPLQANEIGRVSLAVRDPLPLDDYAANPGNGAFILIDEASNQTAAAGMVRLA